MEANMLLESDLKTLRLATFREQYRQVAEDALLNTLGYDQYLLALTQQEVSQRPMEAIINHIKSFKSSIGRFSFL